MIFGGSITQLAFDQVFSAAVEGVGFDAVTADFEERFVDRLDHIGPAEVQHFAGVFMAAPIARQVKRARLEVRPHRAVKHDDPPANQIKKWHSIGHDS